MSEEQIPVPTASGTAGTAEPAPARATPGWPVFPALAIAALLLALGVLVGGYFIWHEVQRLGAWQQQVLGQIDSRGQALEQRLASFQDRFDSDLAAAERNRRQLEEEQRRLVVAQQGLEDAVSVLRAQLGSSEQDWVLAEVQYLLQIANQRLQLMRDVETAAAALQSADRRLRSLGDPGFNAVREQIAAELTELQGVTAPDLAGIAMTLETLARQVGDLPLKDQDSGRAAAVDERADQAAAPESTTDWRRLPALIWEELRNLVVVRRNEVPVGPLLAPEQRFFLHENLRLQLSSARLAALQGQTASYRASLRTALAWLDDHFAEDSPQVAAVRAELERLAELDVRPALPDLSASLRLLRQQMHLNELEAPATDAAP